MRKVVKTPLMMRNNFPARTIEEVKENFDLEKILGFFLNGELENWLELRCYEEELKAVRELSVEDSCLAKELCNIFGVEYTKGENLDVTEIQKKNERLRKLKQYTDDEEILANVDYVAFNQDELDMLYVKGIEKIYLCEGDFEISEEKRKLEYIRVGDIFVKETWRDNLKISIIPQELADVIGERQYAESENYVAWTASVVRNFEYKELDRQFYFQKGARFLDKRVHIWDKKNNHYFSVDVEIGSDACRKLFFAGDKLVLYSDSLFSRKLQIYNIEEKKIKCLYDKSVYGGMLSVCDTRIAFVRYSNNETERTITVLDVQTMDENDIEIIYRDNSTFYLTEQYLFYIKNNTIFKYDFSKKTMGTVFECSKLRVKNLFFYDDILYLHYYYGNKTLKQGEFVGLSSGEKERYIDDIGEYSDSYVVEKLKLFILKKYNKIYFFDMNTKQKRTVSFEPGTCDVICVVGNYLYYRAFSDKYLTHRIDLTEEMNPILINDNLSFIAKTVDSVFKTSNGILKQIKERM